MDINFDEIMPIQFNVLQRASLITLCKRLELFSGDEGTLSDSVLEHISVNSDQTDFTNLQAKTDKEVECLSPLSNLRKNSENVTFKSSWRAVKGSIRKLEEL